MRAWINQRTGRATGVVQWNGESGSAFYVVDCDAPEAEQPAVIATYRERWRAENHAITGCPCRQNWHAYNGAQCEPMACQEGVKP